MNTRWWRLLESAAGLLLFGVALTILHHELRAYHYHDVLAELRGLPRSRVWLAFALTVLNYAALTGYDRLAFAFIGNPLRYARIALASFIAYVFAHNVGLSFLGGSAVRFRLYSGWGLTTSEIAAVAGFNAITFWLGFLTLTGVALLSAPPPLPAAVHLPLASTRILGILCLALLAAYLAVIAVRRSPLRWRDWQLTPPGLRLALLQVGLSVLDWTLAASVLYALLPPLRGVPFIRFVGVYLLAQVAGIASTVPAGLGVFETVILVALGPLAPQSAILGSLLAYRVIYYLVPLIAGVGLLAGHELLERRPAITRLSRLVGRWAPEIIAPALTFTIFLGGVILLASGAVPAAHGRLSWLHDLLPLPVLEVSHFVGSLVGIALLILARGLQRRLDAAYLLATVLLGTGILTSLLKGFNYEEALILSLMLAALLPCRRYFYRRASLLDEPLTAPWVTAILFVLIGVGWLMLWSFKHVEYSHDLWWQFELSAHAPRSLRAAVGVLVLLAAYGTARLLRPARPEPTPPTTADLEQARAVVAASPATSAYLALLGDKLFLFNAARTGFVMYAVEGRSWVAMGDPVAAPAETRELVWEFHELSDRHGGWTVFYEVGARTCHSISTWG